MMLPNKLKMIEVEAKLYYYASYQLPKRTLIIKSNISLEPQDQTFLPSETNPHSRDMPRLTSFTYLSRWIYSNNLGNFSVTPLK